MMVLARNKHNKIKDCAEKPQKPPRTYVDMITEAILSTTDGKATLQDIYRHLQRVEPEYFMGQYTGWTNSIRHNLSLSPCFIKLEKKENGQRRGKGSFWTIDRTQYDDKMKAIKQRQKRNIKTNKAFERRRRPESDSNHYQNLSISSDPGDHKPVIQNDSLSYGNQSFDLHDATRLQNFMANMTDYTQFNTHTNYGGFNGYSQSNQLNDFTQQSIYSPQAFQPYAAHQYIQNIQNLLPQLQQNFQQQYQNHQYNHSFDGQNEIAIDEANNNNNNNNNVNNWHEASPAYGVGANEWNMHAYLNCN